MFLIRLAAALLACAVLSACEITHSGGKTADGYPVKVIGFDEGGVIDLYDDYVRHLKNTRARVEIRGVCRSACTMYLGAHEVCAHPTAAVSFHGSSLNAPGAKAGQDALMASYYTPELRNWFYANAVHKQITWTTLSGQQLHDRFGYELCEV